MKLDEKVGIVTGAGMGMGEAVARRWAKEGAAVVATDVDDEAGERTVAAIKEAGGRALFVHADVSSEADWETVTARALSDFGGLHILHNNAGIHRWIDPLEDPIDLWDQMMAINLKGVFLGCRAAIPHMIAAGGGAIVNTSSTSGLQGVPLQGVYGATKAGVLMLTRSLAKQYGPRNVRVNAICPGPIDTPMLRQAAQERTAIWQRTGGGTPPQGSVTALGRMGTPDEIASVVTFLVSDESSFVTGTWLPVDGGMTA